MVGSIGLFYSLNNGLILNVSMICSVALLHTNAVQSWMFNTCDIDPTCLHKKIKSDNVSVGADERERERGGGTL